ncbi:MAG: CCA tRNA nucleotidyltransferase [Planctomycetes bacterium]|nr:CCA tRNA nucleotidyltransferase [Planctomycetota bacterium]MCW8135342.1 CCA tRNA nucleotidyltransferase [Planctomycetota bacterium]
MRGAGHEALLAGGCVRDLLLGREPKDYDVATSALPDAVEALFARTVPVGKSFGVIRVLDDDDNIAVEVATFRHDGPYLDGRHPSAVTFTDARQDAARRDFTINAMFLDPEAGQVIDHHGGQADLKRGVIRAVGEPRARFEEDKLRLLRAVRFAAGLGFDIEPATWAALCDMAPQVAVCSGERIRDELSKMITNVGAARGLRLMQRSGLMQAILPEVAVMEATPQSPEHHPEGDVFTHTLLGMDVMFKPATVTLALGVLFHDIAKPPTMRHEGERITFHGHDKLGGEMAVKVMQRLRYPGEVMERVKSLIDDHLKFINVPKMKTATLKRLLRKPHFDEDLELHRIDCLAGPNRLGTYHLVKQRLAEFERQGAERALRPKVPIDGRDLIAMGLQPGPKFKELLHALEDEMLEGRVSTRDEAVAFVKSQAGL